VSYISISIITFVSLAVMYSLQLAVDALEMILDTAMLPLLIRLAVSNLTWRRS
jgi:hypothetical protein